MAVEHWLRLSLTEGLGPILARRVIAAAGSPEAACSVNATMLGEIEGIGSVRAATIAAGLCAATGSAAKELEASTKQGIDLICPDDDTYPVMLKQISDPPLVLYCRGALAQRDLNAVAIVGSRKCSIYGREQAERFGYLLAGAGYTVVSGGARGIDSAAHRGALTVSGGRTVAVLGCGADVVYPPENASLFEQIAQSGAIMSELPLGSQPLAEHFPRRNRIVSGLARGVLVIEADERSGALITARLAIDDQNRTVFAVPGRVDSRTSIGPHRLIREGAVLTTGIEDIVDALGPLPQAAFEPETAGDTPAPASEPPSPQSGDISERQSLILSHLNAEAAPVDIIIERCGLDAGIVLQELTYLTLRGLARRIDGGGYARRR